MIKVNMHEAKSRLSELVLAVEKDLETVVLCRDGHPVAQLTRLQPSKDRLACDPGLRVGLRYDPSEPLSEDEFPAEYR